jgi:hypothetical protein
MITKDLSGIVFNQNLEPQDDDTGLGYWSLPDNSWVYQEFRLPFDYVRGSDEEEQEVPDFSGIQILVNISAGLAKYAACDYKLQVNEFGLGWLTLAEGTAIGAPADGVVWMNIFFPDAIPITESQSGAKLRLGISGRTLVPDLPPVVDNRPLLDIPVDYDGSAIIIDNRRIEVGGLIPDEPYAFMDQGVPVFVVYNSKEDQTYYSYQQGIDRWYVSIPNPLDGYDGRAFAANGTTPLTLLANQFSFCFRILGMVADEGIDFLGNRYRSLVLQNKVANLSVEENLKFWLSRPYPSKFAVESLYFDISQNDNIGVIDKILVDPITPGVYFNIYYSNDGDPVERESDWEFKLWTHVPAIFQATGREIHNLPQPIAARYIKLEFSHLQGRYYAPGASQAPTKYKKHPKWILDYFLAKMVYDQINQSDTSIDVVFDALDLAYNYYLDDLRQNAITDLGAIVTFLQDRGDFSDQVDPDTLAKINLSMTPFREHPALRGDDNSVLASQVIAAISGSTDYPVETLAASIPPEDSLTSISNKQSLLEKNYPVMFFYLTSRHRYREVEALLERDRAYFVGIRELVLLRENHLEASDNQQYIEANTDLLSVEQNDFLK